jgi:hypothetical protein
MNDFEIDRPTPIPLALVDVSGSNRLSYTASSRPGPSSATAHRIIPSPFSSGETATCDPGKSIVASLAFLPLWRFSGIGQDLPDLDPGDAPGRFHVFR